MNYGKALAMCGATLVAAGAIGIAVSPVQAREPRALVVIGQSDDLVSRHVSYADLNLAVAPGERTLNRRVGYAVTDVCNEAVGGNSTSFDYIHCSKGAWNGARPQVGLAVQRAREMAAVGTSSLAAVAITIAPPE
jgi:UrcA family protein